MPNTKQNLGTNFELRVHEHIERVVDSAFHRVLDRYNAIISRSASNSSKHVADARFGRVFDGEAELRPCGLMGPGSFWAQESNGQVFVYSQGGGQDFPIDCSDRFRRKASFAFLC